MGSEIYPEIHENPKAFFNSFSPILLEPLAHDSSDWSLPREDCIIVDGPHKKILRTYLRIVAHDKVNVTYDNWKQVPITQKDLI